MTSKENRKRWNAANRAAVNESSRKWRQRNPSASALLNKRRYFIYKACRDWMKAFQPEIFDRIKRQSKKVLPAMMAQEREDDRGIAVRRIFINVKRAA